MAGWSAGDRLRFGDERTRPAADLLAAVPPTEAQHVASLGCGPGNSAELLARRFAAAEVVVGVDPSPATLEAARRRPAEPRPLEQADLAGPAAPPSPGPTSRPPIAAACPRQAGGRGLLRSPRLFLVAVRGSG